jgi:hypothetical protein
MTYPKIINSQYFTTQKLVTMIPNQEDTVPLMLNLTKVNHPISKAKLNSKNNRTKT